MTKRVDENGRAFKGSQAHVQTYVNRRPQELDEAIRAQAPELRGSRITWRAPLERHRFVEPRDEEFLRLLGLEQLATSLKTFWPKGGPVWDALSTVQLRDGAHGH